MRTSAVRRPTQPSGAHDRRGGRRVNPREALPELLHDATEFMLGWNCIAPLKAQLGEPFRVLDARLQSVIEHTLSTPGMDAP
jgi:hypothetical protein